MFQTINSGDSKFFVFTPGKCFPGDSVHDWSKVLAMRAFWSYVRLKGTVELSQKEKCTSTIRIPVETARVKDEGDNSCIFFSYCRSLTVFITLAKHDASKK